MKNPIESPTLADLRHQVGGIKQSMIALQMHVQEPAICKLEQKRLLDTSVDKLKRYINAIGGNVIISIELPDGTVLRI